MLSLDVGCGPRKRSGCVGIDQHPFPGVDVVRDIRRGLPFSDNTVNSITCNHVLEHLDGDDLLFVVDEFWRVSVDGAGWHISMPSYRSPNRFKDPTHRTRDWSPESFDFWKVDAEGNYLIFRGPAYGCHAKLRVAQYGETGNFDIWYTIEVIKP